MPTVDRLAQLPRAYGAALRADVEGFLELLDEMADRTAVVLGSGGALAVARFTADVLMRRTGRLALAASPLAAAALPRLANSSGIVVSSSARNPDVQLAVDALVQRGASPVAIFTNRTRAELKPSLGARVDRVVTFPSVAEDGFLATSSVLSMATVIARLVAGAGGLHASLQAAEIDGDATDLRPRCLVLVPPDHLPAGLDLEARLSETGLAAVQLTDYRNFAHGRHFGLWKNAAQTTVIALVQNGYAELAERTLDLLPADVPVLRMSTEAAWPGSVLEFLTRSIQFVEELATARGLNLARPGVPKFGRRLYHLPLRRLVSSPATQVVDHKLAAAGALGSAGLRGRYEQALTAWVARLHDERFAGVVLDYDGTVCATTERYELPRDDVQDALRRLLEAGAVVAFASGRGTSLHRDLRAWVPEQHWHQVHLGLHNAATMSRLAEAEPQPGQPDGTLVDFARSVAASILGGAVQIRTSTHQISLTAVPGSGLSVTALAQIVRTYLVPRCSAPLSVVTSGHSVDVVHAGVSKVSLLEAVRHEIGGDLMAIGDQGQPGGNDFELLAATESSLSVDRCSADPTRCWRLTTGSGPDALVRYLRALKPLKSGLAFRWSLT